MSAMQGLMTFGTAAPMAILESTTDYREIYERNRHRVYSLAFWMTDNELAAEELMVSAFLRAFSKEASPLAEDLDRALLAELREIMPVGHLTVRCAPSERTLSVRSNIKRCNLERAVVQLPATERLIFLMHDVEQYDHTRIAVTLGLTEQESRSGLHQARLRLRELLAH